MSPAIIFTLLVFALLFFACSRNGSEKEYNLNSVGMPYILLRPGQYFIYKDSASGKADSVIVAESALRKKTFTYTPWFVQTPVSAVRQVHNLSRSLLATFHHQSIKILLYEKLTPQCYHTSHQEH